MDSSVKRFSAGLLAFTWLILSLVIPVSAHAATYNAASNLTGRAWFVPAQGTGIAGLPIVATAATMLGRANPWIAAISLGTPVMQWLLDKKAGGQVAVTSRNAPFPTPPGWTVDALGPKPPLIVSAEYRWGGANGQTYTTPDAACSQLCTDQHAWAPEYSWCVSYTSRSGNDGFQNCYGTLLDGRTGANYANTSRSLACPQGYSTTANGCALADRDSVKWPSDGIPTYSPTTDGTGLEPHPRDPDLSPSPSIKDELHNPQNNYSPDEFGNPTSISFQPQSGGGYRVDQRVQTTNNNQTTTTINNITINNAGTVTNIFTTTVPGSIELASPTSPPVTSGTGSAFPTDYNRESTQQQAVQKLDDIKTGVGAADAPDYNVDQKKTDLNQEIKDKAEALPGQYTDDKNKWFSWVWTPPVGACSPWVNSIHGQTVTWDVCPYIDKIRDVIGYMLAVVSAIAVYSQLFRRED